MSEKNQKIELSDVLDEILLSGEELTAAEIFRWTKEFPQFEIEIMEFAAVQAVEKYVPDLDELPATAREVSAGRLERVREIVQQAVKTRESDETVESLNALAKKQGLRFPELAQKVGLSIPLLANLEQRFVRFASIPEEVFGRLASVLEVSAEAVRNYLRMPPEMTAEASFKAKDKPEKPEQEDFFVLVGRDLRLTPEQKQELLKLKR
jgi:transcriptional regulator with XRE-family HTH domain